MRYTISAYTTTRNCVSMDYPFEASIRSMLAFADEVVVLDTSDGTDDTPARLEALAKAEPKVKVHFAGHLFDWSAPNHGIFDGQTKALSRSKCKGDFLWQFDVDEVVHELDAPKIRPLVEQINKVGQAPLMALPVIEYWGSNGKVRMDINPWKCRLSRNLPDITHGIPIHLRRQINGLDYASPGTDTCDYISKTSGKHIQFMVFADQGSQALQQMAFRNPKLVAVYEGWFNSAIEAFPGVHHYSWYSIERKILQYKMFWTDFWKAMYGPDSAQNKDPNWNPFFEVPWSQVTPEMIASKAKELEEKTGGWIFHNRWDGSKTPHITVNRDHPAVIKEWLSAHGCKRNEPF